LLHFDVKLHRELTAKLIRAIRTINHAITAIQIRQAVVIHRTVELVAVTFYLTVSTVSFIRVVLAVMKSITLIFGRVACQAIGTWQLFIRTRKCRIT